VTTWLHRIVVNAALDLLRRRSSHSVSWSGDPDDLPATEPRQATDSASVTESRLDVDAAMRTLPPPQRAALVLVDMLGYPVADVAVILGVSEGTVKSRCARGRARLLPYLSHLRSGSPGRRNQTVADGVPSEQGGGA
jgi:RNA polymerase sigma-70 factor (ECF subfamily)